MSETPPIGSLVAGKYRVLRKLGSGGMGSLVEAEHPVLKSTVAIKLVRGRSSAQAFRRLIREAEAARALHSEHVVRVFDVGYHDDAPYIVMERLEGSDLATVVEEGPLGIEEAVDSVLEACVGLAEAHALGIIHRDIKPANLFLTRSGQKPVVKVLDFGISKQIDLHADEADPASTAPGQMLGSPYFMSPEQLRNPTKVDARTDVWSLAVTLYNLLTAAHPFEGPKVSEVTAAVFTDAPRNIREHRPDLPESLVCAISSALEKRPDERTPSVRAFAEGIVAFAGKRGRLAAERVATLCEPATSKPAARERAIRSLDVTATDAGLSATLPAESARERASRARLSSDTPAVSRRGLRLPTLVAAGCALAFVSFWLVRPDVTPASSSAPSVASSSVPIQVTPQKLPKAPPPSARSPIQVAAPPVTQRNRVSRASAPAPALPAQPLPSASALPAPPAPPRVDIDGVPILE